MFKLNEVKFPAIRLLRDKEKEIKDRIDMTLKEFIGKEELSSQSSAKNAQITGAGTFDYEGRSVHTTTPGII